MKATLSILLGSVCLCAQTISVQQPSVGGHASVPVLGYTLSGTTLRPIVGTALHASLGPELPVPTGVTAVYLPPRQNYAVLQIASGLAVADLLAVARGEEFETRVKPIPQSLAGVTSVWFSPRGESAVVSANGDLQLIAGLPNNPHVSNLGHQNVTSVAVTDDAEIVLASTASSGIFTFAHGEWQPWSASIQPSAWSFVPGQHSLVAAAESSVEQFADAAQPKLVKTIAVLPEAVDALFISVDATRVLLRSGQSMTVFDVRSGSIRPVSAALTPLRDGDAFLASVEPSVKVVRLSSLAEAN